MPPQPQIAQLETRVTAIEGSLDKISTSINALGEKFDSRSRPQWVVIVGSLGLVVTILGVIGTAWKDPVERIIARQEQDLREVQQSVVPRVEIDNLRAQTAREREEIKARLDRLENPYFAASPGVSK